jgi:hypothetical protein
MFRFFTRKIRAELDDALTELEHLRRDRADLIARLFADEGSDG